jgi:hypothetical protein
VRGLIRGGLSKPAIDGGETIDFSAENVEALPALYRLCWCPSSRQCTDEVDFGDNVGALIIKGPFLGYSRTCHAAQACGEAGEVSLIRGVALTDGDRMMASLACGRSDGIGGTGFPSVSGRSHGISIGARRHGTEFSWGVDGVFGGAVLAGGIYRLCWCPRGYECSTPDAFGLDVGQITVVGPYLNCSMNLFGYSGCADQNRDVIGGTPFAFQGILGVGLQVGDRFMVLDSCGTGPGAAGFPSSSISDAATLAGSQFQWGLGTTPITAVGGQYRLCWCQAGRSCTVSQNFVVDVGSTVVSSPVCAQTFECYIYERCILGQVLNDNLRAVNLKNGDIVRIMEQCAGSLNYDASCPGPRYCEIENSRPSEGAGQAGNLGLRIQYNSAQISFGIEELQTPHGMFRLCWCAGGWGEPCSSADQFAVDAGLMIMAGPSTNQHRTCMRYQECHVNDITGTALEDGDRLLILESCRTGTGMTVTPTILTDFFTSGVKGFSNSGISLPATNDGTSFSWGSVPVDTGGKYKMCWCSKYYSGLTGCEKAENFKVEVGVLSVFGFAQNHRTCFSGHTCVAERIVGFPLSDGDRLMVMREDTGAAKCGTFTGDPIGFGGVMGFPWVGFSSNAVNTTDHPDVPGSGGVVQDFHWGSDQVVRALPGRYKMCFCSASDACVGYADFNRHAGYMHVVHRTFGHLQFETLQKADNL